MNICSYFRDYLGEHLESSHFVFEPSKNSSHGDLATNAAMVLSKLLKKSPQDLAQHIINILKQHPDIESTESAGPGFINIKLSKSFWYTQLLFILKQGESYGEGALTQNINVEFVSVNPTGPLHAGHARNAVLGDVLASLLQKAGCQVVREYYINDAGGQIKALGKSLLVRYKQALGMPLETFTEDMYGGDYLIPVAQSLVRDHGDQLLQRSDFLEFLQDYGVTAMMNNIREDLKSIGVHMDIFTSEKEILAAQRLDEALELLKARGDIYVGTLTPPKGHVIEDWEERPQTLFRSTTYGDDIDRPFKKSDDSWTYFAGDIGYHYDKIQRGYDVLINVFGADHAGYVVRLSSAVKALGQENFEIKTCQLVNFLENGKPVRMSKRQGAFVTLRDIVKRVGKDAARYMMVSRHHDMGIDFDFEKVVEKTHENPVFYIQYAHARICSVQRHARSLFPDLEDPLSENLELLTSCDELLIIKTMVDWPRQVELAARMREPHRIATYLHHLSGEFHKLWSKGKADLRFIEPQNRALTGARLALLAGIQIVLSSGLKLLGMEAVEEM